MGYKKVLRELFTRTFSSSVTVAQAVNFLELNGYFKDADDEEMTRDILSAYKRQEARRFISGIKDCADYRVYANYKDGNQNYYTSVNDETVSEVLHKAETVLFTHISGTRRNYDNIKAKRVKAQAAERRLDRAAKRAARRGNRRYAG